MFNFTKPFERKRLVVRKRICCQWSISTIICICTIAYEDYIILAGCPASLGRKGGREGRGREGGEEGREVRR